jgi:hypothetical protein
MAGQDGGDEYVIQLMTTTGWPLCVLLIIRRKTIEVWHKDRCHAVMDRDLFRIWLERNPGPYCVRDVIWTVNKGEPVVLLIQGSGCWLIPSELIAGLQARV